MDDPHYAVFDIEATGLDVDRDRIFDLAIVHLRADGSEIRRRDSLINPGVPLPEAIRELSGVGDADLVGAPRFRDLAHIVKRRLEGPILVAHNLHGYDGRLIARELVRCGYGFLPRAGVCTLELFRTIEPGAGDFSLADVCERHGVPLVNAHRALPDALATAALVRGLIARGIRPEDVEIDQEPYYRRRAEGNQEPASEGQWMRLKALVRRMPAVAEGRVEPKEQLLLILAEVGVTPTLPVEITKEQIQAAFDLCSAGQ